MLLHGHRRYQVTDRMLKLMAAWSGMCGRHGLKELSAWHGCGRQHKREEVGVGCSVLVLLTPVWDLFLLLSLSCSCGDRWHLFPLLHPSIFYLQVFLSPVVTSWSHLHATQLYALTICLGSGGSFIPLVCHAMLLEGDNPADWVLTSFQSSSRRMAGTRCATISTSSNYCELYKT